LSSSSGILSLHYIYVYYCLFHQIMKKSETAMMDRLRAFQRSDKENKRCADCNEVGPTYITSTFGTFVCTTCCGIHREFGHKIKSISMSKFSLEEVEELERGGNLKANDKWLASYASRDFSLCEDVEKLREHITSKYIRKQWVARDQDQPRLDTRNVDNTLDRRDVRDHSEVVKRRTSPCDSRPQERRDRGQRYGENSAPASVASEDNFNPNSFGAAPSPKPVVAAQTSAEWCDFAAATPAPMPKPSADAVSDLGGLQGLNFDLAPAAATAPTVFDLGAQVEAQIAATADYATEHKNVNGRDFAALDSLSVPARSGTMPSVAGCSPGPACISPQQMMQMQQQIQMQQQMQMMMHMQQMQTMQYSNGC